MSKAATPALDNPNPQGKGSVPVLDALQAFTPRNVSTKAPRQLFSDYFVSLLIISAEFHFKPVPGVPYYLYLKNRQWKLSLIEPQRWRDDHFGDFLGRCELRSDMTWSLEPLVDIQESPQLLEALQIFQDNIVDTFNTGDSLLATLPFFVDELPFYRRLAASGLARSFVQACPDRALLAKPAASFVAALPAFIPETDT